jgi:hypothetical protein
MRMQTLSLTNSLIDSTSLAHYNPYEIFKMPKKLHQFTLDSIKAQNENMAI